MRKTTDKKQSTKDKIKSLLKGTVLGVILMLLLLLAASAVVLSGKVGEDISDALILVCVICGATLSGRYYAGKNQSGVLTSGLESAAAFIVMILIGTLFLTRNEADATLTLRVIIAAIAGGAFGGVLKLHRKGKKSRLRS